MEKSMVDTVDDYFNDYFKSYYAFLNFDGNEGEYKESMKGVILETYQELKKLKKSKISLEHTDDDIEKLKKTAQELQRYSSEEIILDKLPKSLSEIRELVYHFCLIFVFNGKINFANKETKDIFDTAFKAMQDDVFGEKRKRSPKITQRIKNTSKTLQNGLDKSIERIKNFSTKDKKVL